MRQVTTDCSQMMLSQMTASAPKIQNLHKKQRQLGKQAEQMQNVVARPVKNQLPFSSCGDSLAGRLVGSDPQLEL